ncbi:MAG: isochorismate synthase, partial [Marmoricola sp.]
MSHTISPVPRLVARTQEISDPGPLLDLLPADEPMTWLRRGEGVVAWGVAAECRTGGEDRFSSASTWWRNVVRAAAVADEVEVPGSGLICLGSFAFADEPGDSVLVIPRVVVGRRGDRFWVTTIGSTAVETPALSPQDRPEPPVNLVFADGALSGADWEGVVWEAVLHLNAGELDKVVLARDLIATAD